MQTPNSLDVSWCVIKEKRGKHIKSTIKKITYRLVYTILSIISLI